MIKVSIVIVAHNANEHLVDCLGSIYQQSLTDFEVIWVDSASTDSSVQRIRSWYPQVRILPLDTNMGYRRGINAGAKEAGGQYIVVCNQDTAMDREWLEQMVSIAEADPTVGIVAPKILMFDNPGIINEAGNTLHYSGLYGSRGLGAPASEFSSPEELAMMSGCCFLIRRDLWRALGGFSEDFDQLDTGWHASCEDADLAWRAQLMGYRIVYCPRSVMYHKYTSKGMIPPRFCSYEWGRSLFLLRNLQLRTLFILLPILAALEAGAWFYALVKGRPWLVAKVRIAHWLLTHGGQVREMRSRVQKTRKVGDRAIMRRMSCRIRLAHVMRPGRLTRFLQWGLDGGFGVYYHLALLGLALLDRGSTLWGERRGLSRRVGLLIKRAFDILFSLAALILLSPLMGAIALAVRVTLGQPVLFRQERPGLHERPFTLLKFRTMTDARDERGVLLSDAERVTGLGRFLRSTSLDELPELINVLRGEMSLVGPRPLLMSYLPHYTPTQRRRHEVRPGITGLAQINGRNALAWEQRFALDVWYVDHRSIGLDLKIIALTFWKVIKREGINEEGSMTEFTGSTQSL